VIGAVISGGVCLWTTWRAPVIWPLLLVWALVAAAAIGQGRRAVAEHHRNEREL
jgi:hypothetical protein